MVGTYVEDKYGEGKKTLVERVWEQGPWDDGVSYDLASLGLAEARLNRE